MNDKDGKNDKVRPAQVAKLVALMARVHQTAAQDHRSWEQALSLLTAALRHSGRREITEARRRHVNAHYPAIPVMREIEKKIRREFPWW